MADVETPFVVLGEGFTPVGGAATVVFLADAGTPFFEGTSSELDVTAKIVSSTEVAGTTPCLDVSDRVPTHVRVELPDGVTVEGDATIMTFVEPEEPVELEFVFVDSGQRLGRSTSYGCATPDLDGDGDADLVVANWAYQATATWINDGTGGFARGQSFGSVISRDVVAGDLDGDGDADVVSADVGEDRVWWNEGDGHLLLASSLDANQSFAVDVGDVDADGDLDLLTGNRSSRANRLWLNDGMGHFEDSGQALGRDATALLLVDLDGDGDLDAITGSDVSAGLVWVNDGQGRFTSRQDLGVQATTDLAVADVNGDGRPDLLQANGVEGARLWLMDEPGAFVGAGILASTLAVRGVVLGDVDRDGDPDCVLAGDGPNEVWLNDGHGVFTLSQELGDSPSADVALADVDGDDLLDLIVVNGKDVADEIWFCRSR